MKVKFLPSGEEHEIEVNETVLHLAQRVGLHIQSVCKGIPSCAECRVQIAEGEHHVLPPSKKELDLIGTAHYVDRSRLACQLRCYGDLEIDLKEQIEKEKRATQKPKDRLARRDGETSRAVLGGILDNVVAEDAVTPELVEKREIEVVAVEAFKGDPHLDKRDSFYGDFYTGKNKNKSQEGGQRNRSQNQNPNTKNQKQGKGNPNRQLQQNRPHPNQAVQTGEGSGQQQQARNPNQNQNSGNARNRNRKRSPNKGSNQSSGQRNQQNHNSGRQNPSESLSASPVAPTTPDNKNGNVGS